MLQQLSTIPIAFQPLWGRRRAEHRLTPSWYAYVWYENPVLFLPCCLTQETRAMLRRIGIDIHNSTIGDPTGICAIANICEPEGADKSGHFLLPNGIVTSLDPEDQEYLRRKGAFVFPEARVRDSLVRAYFHYVHPFFPIIDVQDFLPKHESATLDRVSAHLLWSMYLAACNVSSKCS